MNLSQWEKSLLEYYLYNHKAKWMRVYNNKHPILETRVVFYTIFKRKIKKTEQTDKEEIIAAKEKLTKKMEKTYSKEEKRILVRWVHLRPIL